MKPEEIILSSVEEDFIKAHLTTDVQQLVLQHSGNNALSIKKLANQIVARQKARLKLSTWYINFRLVFPSPLSVEQASSELTATYKASLVSGDLLLDLTGGMGVDSWAFSFRANRVMYAERFPELATITAHNLAVLERQNVTVTAIDGIALLEQLEGMADWVYLDPARRNEHGGKVVRLSDCEPDVVQYWPLLQAKARHILIKTSPLLDIDTTLRQLPGIYEIHIVAVQNEVKEVLLLGSSTLIQAGQVMIKAINISGSTMISFSFRRDEERAVNIVFSDPELYIYEPNAAILKAGAFRSLAAQLNLKKLAPNSHLYTSDTLIDFPFGRVFGLKHICKPDRKTVHALLPPNKKANLTVRNFPQSAEDLKKKLALNDGGDIYILATSLQNGEKKLLITQKINQNNNALT